MAGLTLTVTAVALTLIAMVVVLLTAVARRTVLQRVARATMDHQAVVVAMAVAVVEEDVETAASMSGVTTASESVATRPFVNSARATTDLVAVVDRPSRTAVMSSNSIESALPSRFKSSISNSINSSRVDTLWNRNLSVSGFPRSLIELTAHVNYTWNNHLFVVQQ